MNLSRSLTVNSDRIIEIQAETGYPNSVSVCLALQKVWNEVQQENEARVAELEREASILRGEHAINAEVFKRYRKALEQIADSTDCYAGCICFAVEALHPKP